MKLEAVADYLFYEFTSGVKKNYGLEGLRQVIEVLVGLGNNNYCGHFEIQQLEL